MSNLRNLLIPSIFLLLVGCGNKNATVECDQTKFDCTPKTETPASEAATLAIQAASEAVSTTDGETITTATTKGDTVEYDRSPDDGVADFMKTKAAKTLANTFAQKASEVFAKEVDPDFDWTLLQYRVVDNNIHTGATQVLVEMSYHERQDPLYCGVDVVWYGSDKYEAGLADPSKCLELYKYQQEHAN